MARNEVHVGHEQFEFIPEMGKGVIEPVDGKNPVKTKEQIELEEFMNEKLLIVVHQTDKDGELPVITPMVNGITQPIVRGVPTPVKRKYVEVLCRNKKEKYKQIDTHNIDALPPMVNRKRLVGMRTVADPFTVIEDKNKKGAAWLDRIINEKE